MAGPWRCSSRRGGFAPGETERQEIHPDARISYDAPDGCLDDSVVALANETRLEGAALSPMLPLATAQRIGRFRKSGQASRNGAKYHTNPLVRVPSMCADSQ
jgi:hypothetical protein